MFWEPSGFAVVSLVWHRHPDQVSGFKITGLLLVAIAWLQVSLTTRAAGKSFPLAGGDQISAGATYAPQVSEEAVQFHQLRLSGFSWWTGKSVDWKTSGPERLSVQTIPAAETFWQVIPAPGELLRTWQFSRRTALQPRAPSEV